MCLKCLKTFGTHFPKNPTDKLLHQQHVEHKEYAETLSSCRSSFTSTSTTDVESSTDTPPSKPIIYTHKLSDSFYLGNSPPEPLSPISYHHHASNMNSPTSSPHIHPISNIDKYMSSLTLNENPRKRLSLDDFTIKQTVGIGSSARVHLVKSKANGKYYAMKAISKKDILSKRQVQHAQNERETLSYVNHPFLVKLWGTFQSESHVFLIMDYAPGGELFRVIRNKKVKK